MKAPSRVSLGPWKGVDNIADETARGFQPGDPADPAQYLRQAVNLDLDRDGRLRKRRGTTKLADLTEGHSLTSIGGRLLLIDRGELKQFDPVTETLSVLVAGLADDPMTFATLGADIYGCNGVDRFRLTRSGVTFWGMESPLTPNLYPTTGSLAAGTYAVALTSESLDGIESGARLPATITVGDDSGIRVSGIYVDPNTAYLNLYLSETNGSLPYWKVRFDWPVIEINIRSGADSKDPLTTFGMSPPPDGANNLMGWNGRAYVTSGNALYWSDPVAYHLWNLRTGVQFMGSAIDRLVPSDGGFYLFEGENTWWVAGDDPEDSIKPTLVDTRPFSGGPALRIPGHLIPSLQAPGLIALWQSADGPVAGLPGGMLVRLTKAHLAFDQYANATFAHREENGISQLLVALNDQTKTNQFAASDRPICEVRRAVPG